MLRENREHWRPIYFSINLVDSFEQLHLHFYCTAICISWPQNCLWKVAHNKHDRGNSVESLAPVALCLVTAPHPWWRVSITNIIGFWHFSIQQDIDPLFLFVFFDSCVWKTMVRFVESEVKNYSSRTSEVCDPARPVNPTHNTLTHQCSQQEELLGLNKWHPQCWAKQGNCYFAYWFCPTWMRSPLYITSSVSCVRVHPWFVCGPIVCQPP